MTKQKVAAGLSTVLAVLLPLAAAAQVGGNLLNLLSLIETIVSRLIPILVALALIYFIWGVI